MEKTPSKISVAAPAFVEFLAENGQGQTTVLRRSSALAKAEGEMLVSTESGKPTQARPTGALRFFGGFEALRSQLLPQTRGA